MPHHMVEFGLRTWHGFWTPVKSWAEVHQAHNGEALRFFAHLAAAIGVPILTLLLAAGLALLITDRIDVRRRRALHSKAMLVGLKAELLAGREAASRALAQFAAGAGVAWTALPQTMVEKVLNEPGLYDLTPDQILELHDLRLSLLRTRDLIKLGIAGPQSAVEDAAPVAARVGSLRGEIQAQLETIGELCDGLLSGLRIPPPVRRRTRRAISAPRQREGDRPDPRRPVARARE